MTANNSADARVVLITGAAQRIGAAIAQCCAQAGWRVALHYRSSAPHDTLAQLTVPSETSDTTYHAAFQADLADETQVAALIPAVLQKMGRIDAVVNNASLFVRDDWDNFSAAQLQQHMQVNLLAPLLLARAIAANAATRAVQSDKASNTRPCIVNVLDQKLWNPNPDFFTYSLSKAALQYAGKMLAQALAPTVRVCSVAPGMTMLGEHQSAENFAAAQQFSLLQQNSTAHDIAQAVRLMLETESITGTELLVDAGSHLVGSARDVAFRVAP